MKTYIKEKEIFDIDTSDIFEDKEVSGLLEAASRYIGEINSVITEVFEFDYIIETMKNIEALTSARIEGTTGNLKDLYLEEALDFNKKKQLKLFSAINYKMTMNHLEEIAEKYKKIDMSLIRHVHKILTQNDPSTKGEPGKFRQKDVIIRNTELGDFKPAYHIKIDGFIERLVNEIKIKDQWASLIQAAITHYQFEAIHPFEDGNGRTGRVLINIQLLLRNTIKSPILNLSQTFDKKRDKYIYYLRKISDERSYKTWIKFFLSSIIEQCKHNRKLIGDLRKIKEDNELNINENVHSPATSIVLKHSLNKLFITIPDTAQYLNERRVSGNRQQIARYNIQKLIDLGILSKTKMRMGKAIIYEHVDLKNMLFKSNIK